MALKVADRVKETTATTGTVSIVLAGTETGFQTFVLGIGNGLETYYTIEDETTGDWETGRGTFTSGPDTLTRDTVIDSSNGGAKVVFAAGTKKVFVVNPSLLVGLVIQTVTPDSFGKADFVEIDSATTPTVAAKGTSADIPIAIKSKGTSSVNINTGASVSPTGLVTGSGFTATTAAANPGGASTFWSFTGNIPTFGASRLPRVDQVETITARWAFNGGTSGVDSPFTVDSTFVVTNLNADFLDGNNASAFALAAHVHAAADITSGTFADARISESSVTQHEAALSIVETQIVDGAILARVASAETISGNWTFSNAGTLLIKPGTLEFGTTLTSEAGLDLQLQASAGQVLELTGPTVRINATTLEFGTTLTSESGLDLSLDSSGGQRINIGGTASSVDFTSDIIMDAANKITSTGQLSLESASNGNIDLAPNGTGFVQVNSDLKVSNDLNVSGNLIVAGSSTVVESETVIIGDNHLYLNSGYTTAAAQTGGLAVNYLPTATVDTVAAGGFVAGIPATSNPTVATTGAATFSVGDMIQISGANDGTNDGLYEVLTHAANLLTVRGIGLTGTVEDFTQNQFTADSTATGAITKVTVSVIRAGTDGVWETAAGAVTGLTFVDLGSPGGAIDNVQFNNPAGTFDGDAEFTWTTGTKVLAITGQITVSKAGTNNENYGDGAGSNLAAGATDNTYLGKNAGNANVSGDRGTFVGKDSGLVVTGSFNTAVGARSAEVLVGGTSNVIVGHLGAQSFVSGTTSIFIGDSTTGGAAVTGVVCIGESGTVTANSGIAIGNAAEVSALRCISIGANTFSGSGADCIFIGNASGSSGGSGVQLIGLGSNTLDATTTCARTIAIGHNAGTALTGPGSDHVIIGDGAGALLTGTNERNVLIGSKAGAVLVGDNSVMIGRNAGLVCTASANVFIGEQCARAVVGAGSSVIIGKSAGTTLVSGSENVIIGNAADVGDGADDSCVIIGRTASGTGDDNVVVGTSANASAAASVVVGRAASGTASGVTVLGRNAFAAGASNIAIGNSSDTGTGIECISIGSSSGNVSGSGLSNISIGVESLNSRTTALNTIAIGTLSAKALLVGSGTFVGHNSGKLCTGDNNSFFGEFSGDTTTTGSDLVLVGASADISTAALTQSVGLGSGVIVTASNQFVVGSSSAPISTVYIGEGTDSAANDSAGQTVTYNWQDGGTATVGIGQNGASVTHNMGTGTNAFAASGANGGNGGDFVIVPGLKGLKDGAGTDGVNGAFIVRQPGGTPGTDEVKISHDGTKAIINTQTSILQIQVNDNEVMSIFSNEITVVKGIRPSSGLNIGAPNGEWLGVYVGDEGGVFWGADQDHKMFYDEATNDELVIQGTSLRIKETNLGFYDTTPAAQPAHIVDADGTLADITTKFNTLLAQHATLGLQAAA